MLDAPGVICGIISGSAGVLNPAGGAPKPAGGAPDEVRDGVHIATLHAGLSNIEKVTKYDHKMAP